MKNKTIKFYTINDNMPSHCPYSNCKLGCTSKSCHRAKYAAITEKWKEKVFELNESIKSEKKSNKLNYEALKVLGIFWPIKD